MTKYYIALIACLSFSTLNATNATMANFEGYDLKTCNKFLKTGKMKIEAMGNPFWNVKRNENVSELIQFFGSENSKKEKVLECDCQATRKLGEVLEKNPKLYRDNGDLRFRVALDSFSRALNTCSKFVDFADKFESIECKYGSINSESVPLLRKAFDSNLNEFSFSFASFHQGYREPVNKDAIKAVFGILRDYLFFGTCYVSAYSDNLHKIGAPETGNTRIKEITIDENSITITYPYSCCAVIDLDNIPSVWNLSDVAIHWERLEWERLEIIPNSCCAVIDLDNIPSVWNFSVDTIPWERLEIIPN